MMENDSGIAKGEKENGEKDRNISLGRRVEDGLGVLSLQPV